MKDDLQNPVTQRQFKAAMGKIDERFRSIEEKMYTKADHDRFLEELKNTMYTKADHDKYMVWMDETMTELRDSRDERKLSEHQVGRLDDRVVDHEKRIRILEKQKVL